VRRRRLSIAVAWCLLLPLNALAQTPASPPSKWEVEVHGGWMPVSHSSLSAPEPVYPVAVQPIFTTINGFPSYRVSSWWLGGGPAMTNTVGTALGTVDRLNGPPVMAPLARRAGGATIGARLTRRIGVRYEFEVSFEYAASSIALLDEALARTRAAAESFVPAWRGILGKMPAEAVDVSATLDIDPGSSRDLALTGAFNINFRTAGRWRPYVTFGVGLISSPGERPVLTLTGRQQFTLQGARFDETDAVTIRVDAERHAPAAVAGGGIRRQTARGVGLRVDARAHITANPFVTLVDAAPHQVLASAGAATAVFATATAPSLQVNNAAGSSIPSSFGLPFGGKRQTFKGGGLIARVTLTAGIFWRF